MINIKILSFYIAPIIYIGMSRNIYNLSINILNYLNTKNIYLQHL